MGSFAGEIKVFQKKADLSHKWLSLQPLWLRDFLEAVGEYRPFIWGMATRQPHINGSGERPSLYLLKTT